MKMIIVRDCRECLAHLNGASFQQKHTEQSRTLPNGKWHHATKAGRLLHILATSKQTLGK
jgi:hypothetical protein